MMLAADIVVAADTARFCQMESKRGIAPLAGAHFRFLTRTGWGNAMYHLMLCDEFDAQRALQIATVRVKGPGRYRRRPARCWRWCWASPYWAWHQIARRR
jgi:hypothetical protein